MRVFPIALVMASLACHSGLRSGPTPSRKIGSYGFRISLSGREPVEGAFSIERDTVIAETGGQGCRRDPGRAGPAHLHSFSCFPPAGFDKFGLTVDSDHPPSSTWTIIQSVMKTRTVCARYTVTERGQRICAENRSENYFEDVRIGGRLSIIAVDTAGHPGIREQYLHTIPTGH